MPPVARYARSGDLHIAYTVHGDGPVDLVWIPPWISQVEYLWSEPGLAAVADRLAQFARLITFDRRGSGLSDPLHGAPTLEEQMDDVLAVLDAAGSERAAIAATLEGGPMALLFAATHPDRTSALVLYATFVRATWAPDYDWAWSAEERDERMAKSVEHWGEGLVAGSVAESRMGDPAFMEWAGRLERLAASPGTIQRILDLIGEFDVRDVLPSIRVPTLVMHRRQDRFIKVEHSRYIAKHVPGARYVELDGTDNMFAVGDSESILGEIEEFLTGARHTREPDRMLATVMFTDIVDSTRRAADLGDRSWRDLLERHDELFRRALDRHRGREVKRTGDGFLATFDGPARAIRCAASITEAVETLGLELRAGLHTGECEVMSDDVGGLAVHIAARVMAQADAGEVLVSSTVKDLVVGSGIDFEDRGPHELRGVPGDWRLFRVT
ncbi:MAG TPA: alpha/beta fold hydrolase [Thermoleophilaceae bacterium]|nr:alpha/beta fold hydrolase [Thermoleophilaceae bacterium]